jgi:hypothetical protein
MTSPSKAATVSSRDLALELLDPGSESLVRLFQYPGGDWEPPEPKHRNLRVDPPAGHKDDFAVLYTGASLPAVAMECLILNAAPDNKYTWNRKRAEVYRVVRYEFSAPALFVPIDGDNRRALGLADRRTAFLGYGPYQEVSLALFQRFGQVAHGLSWESFHRNQPGRVYALWHHHKGTIGLARRSRLYLPLIDDPEWQLFLTENPGIEESIEP